MDDKSQWIKGKCEEGFSYGELFGAPDWYDTPWKEFNLEWTRDENLELKRYCMKIKENINKEEMTPLKRLRATMEGKERDRLLIDMWYLTISATRVLDGWADALKPIDLYRNPKLYVKANLAYVARFGFDFPQLYSLSYGESEWGGKAKLLEYAHPIQTEAAVKEPEDVEHLVVPDPNKAGLYPGQLWAIHETKEIMKEHDIADQMPLSITMCTNPMGCATLGIRGLKNFLLDVRRNPELTHRIMELATEFGVRFGRACIDAGADIIECCEGPGVMPPKYWKDYARYYAQMAQEIVKHGANKNIPFWWGFAFDSRKHLPILHEAGGTGKDSAVGWFLLPDFPYEPACAFAEEQDLFIAWSVKDKTLLTGPTKAIEEEVRNIIKAQCVDHDIPKAAIGGGVLDYWTPPENIDAYMKIVKELGKFPINI